MATKKVAKMAKKNTFTINDKEYTAKDFGVNMICDMQDIGFDVTEKINNVLQFVRAYIAVCSGTYDLEFAGSEMDEHMKKGKNFDDLRDILDLKVEESGFFRQNSKTAAETAATVPEQDSEETDEKTE